GRSPARLNCSSAAVVSQAGGAGFEWPEEDSGNRTEARGDHRRGLRRTAADTRTFSRPLGVLFGRGRARRDRGRPGGARRGGRAGAYEPRATGGGGAHRLAFRHHAQTRPRNSPILAAALCAGGTLASVAAGLWTAARSGVLFVGNRPFHQRRGSS